MGLIIQIQFMFIIIYCEYFLYLNMGIELIKDKQSDQNRLISMSKSFKVANSYGNDIRCDAIFYFLKFF